MYYRTSMTDCITLCTWPDICPEHSCVKGAVPLSPASSFSPPTVCPCPVVSPHPSRCSQEEGPTTPPCPQLCLPSPLILTPPTPNPELYLPTSNISPLTFCYLPFFCSLLIIYAVYTNCMYEPFPSLFSYPLHGREIIFFTAI